MNCDKIINPAQESLTWQLNFGTKVISYCQKVFIFVENLYTLHVMKQSAVCLFNTWPTENHQFAKMTYSKPVKTRDIFKSKLTII